jgi:hypothetical protein
LGGWWGARMKSNGRIYMIKYKENQESVVGENDSAVEINLD